MEKKTYILVGIIVFLFVAIGFFTIRNQYASTRASGQNVRDKAQEIVQDTPMTQEDVLALTDRDVVIGDPAADIVIYEYLSYTCMHCADFAEKVFPKLQEEYIDKGLVQFVIRDFPLDEPGLRAAQLTRCIAKDKFASLNKVLLKNRASWAYVKDFPEKLENIAKLAGMSGEDYHKCMANKEVEDYVLTGRINAAKMFQVSSTPTIIINGRKNEKPNDFATLKGIIDELLNQTGE